MPKFAANLTLMFTEVDFLDRFEAAAKAGFKAVEFHFPYACGKAQIAERAAAHGLRQVLFNLPACDWQAVDRGLAFRPGPASGGLGVVAGALVRRTGAALRGGDEAAHDHGVVSLPRRAHQRKVALVQEAQGGDEADAALEATPQRAHLLDGGRDLHRC